MTRRTKSPAARRTSTVALTLAVVALLSLSLSGAHSAATSPSTAGPAPAFAPHLASPHSAAAAAAPAPSAAPLGLSGASAGSVVATAYVNYNATSPGNFPSAVWDWATGQSTVDPVTDQVWIPERVVVLDGVPPPASAPALVYSASTNQTSMAANLTDTYGVAFDPLNGYLYATQPTRNDVVVFDPTTEALVGAPIPVGTAPTAILYDPVSQNLYVANELSNNVTVINGTSSVVHVRGIAVGTNPVALADDVVDQEIFVANSGGASVSNISTVHNTAAIAIPLTDDPFSLAFSSEYDLLAVGMPASSKLPIFDGLNHAETQLVPVGLNVSSVVSSFNGAVFLLTNGTVPDLIAVNATSGVVEGTNLAVPEVPTRLTLDPTNGNIYAWSNSTRTISTIHQYLGPSYQTSPNLGARALTLAYDSASDHVFIADRTVNSLAVLNASTLKTARSPIPLPGTPVSLVEDEASGVVYAGYDGGVAGYDASTGLLLTENNSLAGNNSQLVIDPASNLLWDLNKVSGLEALSLPGLEVVQVVGIGASTSNVRGVALDTDTNDLFVVNLVNATIAVVDGTTGEQLVPAISGIPGLISVAYDPADQEVYALGHAVWVVNPTTRTIVAGPIAIAPHIVAWSISYDPSREFLDVVTNGVPALTGNLTVIDGSSIAASEGSTATIPLGQVPVDVLPVLLPGSSAPGSGELWVPNYGSGTVSIIASPPQVTFLAATPNPVDLGGTSTILLGLTGGAGPSQVSYSGLPPGCASSDTLTLSCSPESTGSYAITANVVDGLGFTASSGTVISVSPAVRVQVTLDTSADGQVDIGNSVYGFALATGGTAPYNYSWAFGDSGVASGGSVTHTYAAVGVYLVTVIVTDAGRGLSSSTSTLTVVPLPTVTVSASPSSVTDVGIPILFSGTFAGGTTPGNSSWTFGDGNSSTLATVSHVYTKSALYYATFHYRDASGVNVSQYLSVQVNPALSATATIAAVPAGSSIAPGTTLDFITTIQGGTEPYTVVWAFDDGSFAGGVSSEHAYAAAGTYTVTLSVRDAAGAYSNSTQQVVVGGAAGSSGVGGGFYNGLLLGVLVGAAIAAVLLFATARSKKRPPAPPTAYVPPAEGTEGAVVPEGPAWQES